MLFGKAGRSILKNRAVRLLREPMQMFETAHYLGVPLDTRLTWLTHIDHVGKKWHADWECWDLS
jgi:hypothetical protein